MLYPFFGKVAEIVVADISISGGVIAAKGEICAYQYIAFCVFEIVGRVSVVIGLKVCAVAVGVNNAEISLYAHRARQGVK